jgi:hypothetical protein
VPIIVGMSTPLFLTCIVPLFIFYLVVQVGEAVFFTRSLHSGDAAV